MLLKMSAAYVDFNSSDCGPFETAREEQLDPETHATNSQPEKGFEDSGVSLHLNQHQQPAVSVGPEAVIFECATNIALQDNIVESSQSNTVSYDGVSSSVNLPAKGRAGEISSTESPPFRSATTGNSEQAETVNSLDKGSLNCLNSVDDTSNNLYPIDGPSIQTTPPIPRHEALAQSSNLPFLARASTEPPNSPLSPTSTHAPPVQNFLTSTTSTCESLNLCFPATPVARTSKPGASGQYAFSRSRSEEPSLIRQEVSPKAGIEEQSSGNAKSSAPEKFLSSVPSFSSHKDLQDLPTILDEAHAREANLKDGAIKILLKGDPKPVGLVSLTFDTFTFSLSYKGGLIYAPRSIKEKQVEVNLESKKSHKFYETSPEALALDFEKLIKDQKINIVDYVPDIPVESDSPLRDSLGLPPSILTALPNNVLSTLTTKFIGINTCTAFLSPTYGSPFAAHLEDLKFGSANHLLYGMPKLWIVVPPSEKEKFEKMIRNKTRSRRRCSQFVRHLGSYIPIPMLKASGIRFHLILQRPGEVIFTFPNAYHQGFNLGPNIAEAINYATKLDFDNYMECSRSCTEGFLPIKKVHILSSQPSKHPLEKSGDPPPKKPRLRNSAIPEFGNAYAMAQVIRRLIAAKRQASSQTEQFSDEDLSALWKQTKIVGDRNILELRFANERFSRCWADLSRSQPRRTMGTFMKKKLGILDQQSYNVARNTASRGSIWVRLCDIFEEDLKDNKYVVVCGSTGSRSLEDLTAYERGKLLQSVQERKAELLPLFQAVLPAFLFIVGRHPSLPALRIERALMPGEEDTEELSHLSTVNFQEYFRMDDMTSRV